MAGLLGRRLLTDFVRYSKCLEGIKPMAISSNDTISLTNARTTLTELCAQVKQAHGEIIITKNGESCAALIDTERLDYYHRLAREHVHIKLLEEAVRGLDDANAGSVITVMKLKTQYRR
jgi:prevent-host-death family protein